ncbi:MAG TPA: alpha-glucan family phosphorylase [Chthonomonadaceae bacterium]|nr:alpha-glucan family phosphorylase [Chthonomonadaceae bacterium]
MNMAYLALHSCGQVTAVSRLHRQVSQHLFADLFPRWPAGETPVGYVTNGVHVPSWDSEAAGALWTRACGKENWQAALLDPAGTEFQKIGDKDLWDYRNAARRSLIEHVRRRLTHQAHQHAASADTIERAGRALSFDTLTLGFARRFATYKRPTLLLHDPARLTALLTRSERPLQLIIAGKAHPADVEGKRMVQEVAEFASRPYLREHIVFIEDYDMALMEQLAAGIDVWINTPRRPWEASGTSGMKLLVNGGLNLSEVDGWWAEAYRPEVGWALGDGQEHDDPGWDAREAEQLYSLLEQSVLPEFYGRDAAGIPEAWLRRVRASMSELTPRYSSYRMLREYVEQVYLPGAAAYRRRVAEGAALAVTLQEWQQHLADHWHELRFGAFSVRQDRAAWQFSVEVSFGGINPDFVRVELYADPLNEMAAPPIVMKRSRQPARSGPAALYTAIAPTSRPAEHYTPRLVPFHPEARIPLEEDHILWQR